MKRILIYLSLVLLLSCNTTKRAEKRIYNIVENHQELVKKDTVKIDTVLTVPVLQDSAIFDLNTIVGNQTHTIRTERGQFGITILPSKEVKINYLPDSVDIHFRTEKIYDQIAIEQPKEKWREVLWAIIIAFVGLLFLKMFFERMMK